MSFETWVFDLDNTLYPASSSLFPQIHTRMGLYIAETLKVDAKTPTQPVVTMPDGPFTASFDELRFIWTSTVTLGTLTTAQYAIGTTPGGQQVSTYTVIPVNVATVTAPTGCTSQ